MKSWKLAAIAASFAAAAFAGVAPAAAQDGARVGIWEISANPGNGTCMAFASGGAAFFGIQHSNKPEQRFMLVNNKSWTNLENGAEYEGTITAGRSYSVTFTGVVSSDITPTLGASPPAGMDQALRNARSIRLQVPSQNIDVSVPVSDGAKLWDALSTCVANNG
ncbi:MAG: hypothetical protein ACAH11_01265 [Sphingomonas sp.]